MTSTGLWLARLFPLFGIAFHIFGAFTAFYAEDRTAGMLIIAGSWAFLIAYGLIFHFRGDFIQRALNMGVKSRCGDEFQRDKARLAYTAGYIVVLFACSAVVGMNWDVFLFEETTDPVEIAQAGYAMFLQFLSALYIGAFLPTLFLGVTMKPLERDMGEAAAGAGRQG
ncbi:hypothetical protein [Euryhalocaulis caribicus]|uniref:hypothetical protein n=1 Tax=Euryhalocaulis caribicus TaxID=1161401 RepID=UPI00039F4FA4|nr:hypothetical protein [Euryhalocaulis caribicus]